jgi:hypothetical protein
MTPRVREPTRAVSVRSSRLMAARIVQAPGRRSKRARTPSSPAVRYLDRLITLSRLPLSARPTDRRPERRAHDESV